VDSDEHRRTMGRRGNPSHRRARTNWTFTTTGQRCKAGTNEGPDPMPIGLWRTEEVTPSLAWHPALRLTAARTTPDDPSTQDEVA
jgi:hypothetical protein